MSSHIKSDEEPIVCKRTLSRVGRQNLSTTRSQGFIDEMIVLQKRTQRGGAGHKRTRIEIYIFPPRPLRPAMDTSTRHNCPVDAVEMKGGYVRGEGRESE